MKTRAIIAFSLAILCGSPNVPAQSFLKKVKSAAEKVGKQVKDDLSKQATPAKSASNQQTNRNSELQKQHDAMVGKGNNKNAEDQAATVKLPKTHTALFAPLGYPTDAKYGIKSAKPVLPPKNADAQVAWSEKLPYVYELNNQSLVNEYLMLDSCFAAGHFATLTPADWRYRHLLQEELYDRTNALNDFVKYYNETLSEYEDEEKPQWVINGCHRHIASILDGRPYKTLVRSSIAPLFKVPNYISDETKAYFKNHGGYANAHKATWTVWDPEPNKKSVSTSTAGQAGKVVSENQSGATIDLGGVIYILHNGRNGSQGHAFISEAVKTAVAGKAIEIPDYVTYNGKKYPVTGMRGQIFSKTTIKSVKLPSMLKEITNSAFRETPITEIVIPASVKKIQGSAFYGCKNLTKVTFEGDNVNELHGCFQNCTNLTSLKFPRRVGLMSYEMCNGCINLSDVTLPENITQIYPKMFAGCKKLTKISIPQSVTKIEGGAFAGSGIVELDASNVKEFGSGCLSNCNALKTLKLNSSLKENFLTDIYSELGIENNPSLQVKYVNDQYVYPKGLIFVDGK